MSIFSWPADKNTRPSDILFSLRGFLHILAVGWSTKQSSDEQQRNQSYWLQVIISAVNIFFGGNSYSRLGFLVYESLWAVQINTQEPSDRKGENPKHSYNRKTVPQVSPRWRCYAGFIHQRPSYCFHQVFIMTLHSTIGSIYSFTKAEVKLDDSSDILWQCRWATFAKTQFQMYSKAR